MDRKTRRSLLLDLMNDGKVGIEAISPAALPLIPDSILQLVTQRREQMMNAEWDPFTEHEFVSNGTGMEGLHERRRRLEREVELVPGSRSRTVRPGHAKAFLR